MILRMFDTAIVPDDEDEARRLFREQVKPAFDAFEGCHGIEMLIGLEEHSGGFMDIAAISKWDSVEHIEAAVQSADYTKALAELKTLFRQTPIVRHFATDT
ncbi:MAG: antibiotic biosynthesis monooxygenase family protein [Actinomycetota bacterium]